MNGRFLINRGDAKVMGVAAGLADYTGIDPTIVRVGFIALTLMTGPVVGSDNECKRGLTMFTIASARETATVIAGAFLSALLLVSAATSLPIA